MRVSRAYYYGRGGGVGLCPWDNQVGLTPKRLPPAAERAVSLAGRRWREPGTAAVGHLRALDKSERAQGEHFWRRETRGGTDALPTNKTPTHA